MTKDLYLVTIAVAAGGDLTVICREYVEAYGAAAAEQEAKLALSRRWRSADDASFHTRSIECGVFVLMDQARRLGVDPEGT